MIRRSCLPVYTVVLKRYKTTTVFQNLPKGSLVERKISRLYIFKSGSTDGET